MEHSDCGWVSGADEELAGVQNKGESEAMSIHGESVVEVGSWFMLEIQRSSHSEPGRAHDA